MLGLKLNHVSKRGHRSIQSAPFTMHCCRGGTYQQSGNIPMRIYHIFSSTFIYLGTNIRLYAIKYPRHFVVFRFVAFSVCSVLPHEQLGQSYCPRVSRIAHGSVKYPQSKRKTTACTKLQHDTSKCVILCKISWVCFGRMCVWTGDVASLMAPAATTLIKYSR